MNASAPAKGIAVAVSGRCVEISVLRAAAKRFGAAGRVCVGSKASVVFCSRQFGDSPAVAGSVKAAEYVDRFTRLTIEIADWRKLAQFWDTVLRR